MKYILTGLAMMAGAHAPAVAGERIEATYDFLWKGIRVSTLEARADLAPESYDLAINFRMRGIAKLFSSGHSELTARGTYGGDYEVLPLHYSSTGRWDGEDYSRTLVFGADGMLKDMQQDWPEKWTRKYPREEVPDHLERGPDPASLAVALLKTRIPAIATSEPVGIPVFDGDTVVEWQVQCDVEPSQLEASSHSEFSGPAHECRIGAQTLAGQRILTEKEKKKIEKEREKRRRKAEKGEAKEEESPRFWVMAQGDSGYLLPVRATFPAGMGDVDMYLKTLTISPLPAPTPEYSR